MNGAHALLRTLVQNGVTTCFTNPGTSEMHFVAALDDVPEMRAVLALFEGVATGAADGYARMSGAPAATLLHLGPGLGNGLANLHNARRARTPVVNIVGDHATYHQPLDAPLASDIVSVANNVSTWVRESRSSADIGKDATDAILAALNGCVATLILTADASWSDGAEVGPHAAIPYVMRTADVEVAAKALRSDEPSALLLGGAAVRDVDALNVASGIAAATGAKVLCETFPARLERGAGVPAVERLGYLAEFAVAQMQGLRHLVLVDAKAPVSFFAYPEKPSVLVPEGCEVHELVPEGFHVTPTLEALLSAVGGTLAGAAPAPATRPERPTGALTPESLANAIGALLPEGAIVSDEANTAGLFVSGATAGAPPHSWLTLTGGAIGQGMPVATGAAVACPDRPVISLEADGSAMYTLQSLWTQAREGLDVTTVIFDNQSYAILNLELSRVGARTDGNAGDLFDLSRPPLDFVALSQGMGVPAARAETAEDVVRELERALAEPGPHLIHAILPSRL
ncbi:MAG TPA: acetolactate synthase large subunit [Acidimicrobiia bacterium]|jgi:acetolactate synthase-1/2/3 large subunit|nr:acetolactate synthase large subunit [Acidimicrobiia bacterium]